MTTTKNTRNAFQTPSIVIIGTGFGGLGMAIQLKEAGIESFTILEKAASVGGTWRDNTYPGAACDVQSHLYSYSFEPKSDWSRKFGLQPEIHSYMEHCASKHGLHDHIHFNQEVESVTFHKETGLWTLVTKSGDTFEAKVVVSATGQLNQPAYPNIPGIDTFKGKVFHSARWDHDYDLTEKRVAVIGTGASAIQFVPQIVSKVKELKLFQRSAAWVIPKPDRIFSGAEQWVFERLPVADRVYRSLIYWKNESRALAFTRFGFLMIPFERKAKSLARTKIKDPVKRAAIIPDYPIGCKRVLISNDWYDAINQDNLAHNSILFMLESQIRYVIQCINMLLDPGLHYMNVKAGRQSDYSRKIQEKLKGSVWEAGCTSWYKTASGKNTNNWPGFTFSYRRMTSNLNPQDYELSRASLATEKL